MIKKFYKVQHHIIANSPNGRDSSTNITHQGSSRLFTFRILGLEEKGQKMGTRQKMKNITIALPEIYVTNIEKIQNLGLVPSRSEAIRLAIREFLHKEIKTCELLGYDLENRGE